MNKNIIIQKQNFRNYSSLITPRISPLLARTLFNRNIKTIEEANDFLFGGLELLPSAYEIKDIQKVYEILSNSMEKMEKIAVFGDYDSDGVSSTGILVNFLQDMCVDYIWRLPDRLNEGYGISKIAIQELYEKGAKLIITVDNGIAANEEIKMAKELGMKVIVLDHHSVTKALPDADVIIDLHLEGETYPFTEVCGAGLAFLVVCFLYEEFGFGYEEGYKFLDLAAIGTVADVVTLTGANRIIVKEGLKMINSKEYSRVGVLELIKSFGLINGTITSMDIGFKLSPAINAPGRLYPKGADLSLKLLLSTNTDEALSYAYDLFSINEIRKEISENGLQKAEQYLLDNNLLDNKILVLFLENIPEGVIGLVSGKITEKYNKPSLVFTEGKNEFKASGRSIPEYHLLNGLNTCKDLFEKYGGHAQAAGISIKKDMDILKQLNKRLNKHADSLLTEKDLIKKIYIEEVVEENKLTMSFVRKLDLLEPFGMGNPKPNFLIKKYFCKKRRNAKINEWNSFSYMGDRQNHLKLFGIKTNAIGFNMVDDFETLKRPREVQLAFTLGINVFMNWKTVQLQIIDMDIPNKVVCSNTNNNKRVELSNKINNAVANLQFLNN